MSSITIHLIKEKRDQSLPQGSTGADLAKELHLTEPAQALALLLNGKAVDLTTPLQNGDQVAFISFDDDQGKEIFWHTSAHLLAQAVLRLWPNAKPTIGPAIENGFYYDFANLTVTENDFARIDEEMEKIVQEKLTPQRTVFETQEAAKKEFAGNPYKIELIESFEEGDISAYRQGDFIDLCRGPHLPNLGKIKAVKTVKTSGAYWRGDPSREMLTRLYGISFPDRSQLKAYLQQQEEAKKRDHKVIGPKLGLFTLYEDLAPGFPFLLPAGMVVWNELLRYWRECHEEAGYQEVSTPLIMMRELWEISGHWQNYRQNMYTLTIDEKDFAIKPMNCPGGMLCYKTSIHSYRDLPLRYAEIGLVHRHEAHGALSGLVRVRSFHQDDSHIFLTMEQLDGEIKAILDLVEKMYSTFGLSYEFSLSTRPEKDTIGTDEAWEKSTAALQAGLESRSLPYRINKGDGAFYGPKIDIQIRDALGRKWQTCTIQLDMNLPERFDLTYDAQDGTKKRPAVLHRVIYGSIERFLGILIENFAGKFPLWCSPRQVRLLPIADRHLDYCKELHDKLRHLRFHVETDSSAESMGKKIREAQLSQVNYMLAIGDREVETKTVSVRTRDNVNHGEMPFERFLEVIQKERHDRALNSPLSKT